MKIGEHEVTGSVYGPVFICFLVALFEGLDIQSMGVAAPRLGPAFGLTPGQIGMVMSASTLGLMIGAALGGWISDRIGRKTVLIFSMAALAVFSLATTIAPGYPTLLVIRVLAGLGLGGAFPNLIALVSEVAPQRIRVTALGLMYCGLPIGGAAAGAIAASASSADWRPVFYVGGLGPLLLIPVLAGGLRGRAGSPNLSAQPSSRRESATRETNLFGSRTRVTLLLWASYFFTLLVVYLLLNWLPSLLVARGYSHAQAAASSIVLNVGAVLGSLFLGGITDRGFPRATLAITYAGMTASLLVIAIGQGGALFAVAMGRIGSILGPLLAGFLLSLGFTPNAVPVAAIPGLLIAFAAAFALVPGQTSARN